MPNDQFIGYLYTGDCGPDQMGLKKITRSMFNNVPQVIALHTDCLQHGNHRIVKRGLELIDQVLESSADASFNKYYSSLCKVVLTWRVCCQSMFRAWAAMHGPRSALDHARRLPPRPITGRWGTIEATEAFINKADMQLICPVFTSVVGKIDMKKSAQVLILKEGADKATNSEVNEHGIEETLTYCEKVGRWRRDALSVVKDAIFRIVVAFSHRARAPLTHFMALNQKKHSNAELWLEGPALTQLITGKADDIAAEFDEMLDEPFWGTTLVSWLKQINN